MLSMLRTQVQYLAGELRSHKATGCGQKNKTIKNRSFSGGPVVKNLLCNAGDTGSIPGPRRPHLPWNN